MSEPDTNVMRATYATAATYRQSPDPERAAKFDAWLDQVRADARREGLADGWDEGEQDGRRNERVWIEDDETSNPYRLEATR